ncbi:MAG: low temperature requirement protein A [Oscillospiraceae bacterium]|nr:low temperature requirement protein A [Oscillospiraceae bacterium]
MLKTEKKVEYLELIYDLIFVYIIGRNNSLLHNIENGFVDGRVFLVYILCSLAVIQVWNFSTFYINMYGRNGVRDHVSLFLNMYLLYYIGEGTRLHWESFQNQYHAAWALILINLGAQYAIELRHHRDQPEDARAIRGMMAALFGEAAIVLLAIPVYNRTGIPLAGAAILCGIAATWAFSGRSRSRQVDFTHLTERAMLYVVFTFGEMIIAIASYFEGGLTGSSVYFSGMCFLIAAGLFLCYEVLYDHIVDREMENSGMGYMLIHIFLIFAMNIITASLEFMRNEEVALWPKVLLLTGAFLLYFLCLFALLSYAREEMKRCSRFILRVAVLSAAFAALMVLLRENMRLNILISVLFVFAQFGMLLHFRRQNERRRPVQEERV